MAFVVTSSRQVVNGRVVLRLRVEESGARDTSEWNTAGIEHEIPPSGEIRHFQAQLQSGTGTTIQPRLGKVSGWTDNTIQAIVGTTPAAAWFNEGIPVPYTFQVGARPVLYGRSTPNNAATNHSIVTLITIVGAG